MSESQGFSAAAQEKAAIRNRLESSVTVLLRLRDWRGVPEETALHWQRLQMALIEARGEWAASTRWKEPTPEEVRHMWDALSWLRFLLPTEGKLIVMIVAGVSSKALCKYFEWSPEQVAAAFEQAIRTIEDGLAGEIAA